MSETIQSTVSGSQTNFVAKYCETYKCNAADFENNLLWRCMYSPASFLARLVWVINRDIFKMDRELVTDLRSATSFAEVRNIINFYSIPPQYDSYARRWLKMRMSKGKLLNIVTPLFDSIKG